MTMIKFRKAILMLSLPAVMMTSSCADLEVENLNNATIADVLANPGDYPGLVDGATLRWWTALHYEFPQMALGVAGQAHSASWGNWGMQDLGTIPRMPVQNTLVYNNRGFMTIPWGRLNNSLSQVNEVYRVMNDVHGGRAIDPNSGEDKTNTVVAGIKMVQGLSLGWLGLLFDRAFIADENVPADQLARLELRPYTEVILAAVTKLEEAAAIYDANPTVQFPSISGVLLTGPQAARFARSYAAMLLVKSARDLQESNSTNWARVLQLTNNVQNFDVSPAGDGGTSWWSRQLVQGQDPGWVRVSQRIIAASEGVPAGPSWTAGNIDPLHPIAPYPWPGSIPSWNGQSITPRATMPRITNPRDRRVDTDFAFAGNPPFAVGRGRYFFGTYRYVRYDSYRLNQFIGPMAMFREAEARLIRAEALIRTGQRTQGADIINETRVTRGGLPPVTGAMTTEQLLDALVYERLMEFSWDGSCNPWLYRRSSGAPMHQLHVGTARHLPIPAAELDILGIPVYTFGGDTER